MEEDLKKDLEQMAQEEGRSLNNLINHLLKCAVVSKGILRGLKVQTYPRGESYCKNCPYLNTPKCKIYGKGFGDVFCTKEKDK